MTNSGGNMISGKTRIIGIVADPIDHVRTPQRFNAYLQRIGCDAVLVPFHVRPQDFAGFVAGLTAIRSLTGLVVTIPYKEAVVQHCTDLTEAAQRSGAVNILRIDHQARTLTGSNLDGEGFVQGLLGQGHAIAGRRVYLAGAGGAAKAIAHALARHGASAIAIYNRTENRARQLVQELRTQYPQLDAKVGGASPENCTLAVNATSLGLKPGDVLPFGLDCLPVDTLIAEVVMNPDMTPLLVAAKERGHPIHLGHHMVDAQIEQMAHFLGLH